MRCGKPLHREDSTQEVSAEFCYDCSHKQHLFERGICLYRYDSIRRTVYRFKYAGRREYAVFLGQEMAAGLGKILLNWKPDALVPVPLHTSRQQKRGYNQAALLAEEIGKHLDIPVLENWIIREKNT